MKKTLITSIFLIIGATSAYAAAPNCNPATGNWANAAPTTCRFLSPGDDTPRSVPEHTLPTRETPTLEERVD